MRKKIEKKSVLLLVFSVVHDGVEVVQLYCFRSVVTLTPEAPHLPPKIAIDSGEEFAWGADVLKFHG